jgi:hypothetical protein
MASTALLALFAQLGAAIAGFSGIIVALDTRSVRNWSAVRREGLRSLLQVSGVVVLFSVVPLILGRRLPEPELWTWALGAYGVVHVGDVLSFLLRQRHDTPAAAKAGAWTGLGIALAQLATAAFASASTSEMVYLGVLGWHLAIAAGSFVYLLYRHDPDSARV